MRRSDIKAMQLGIERLRTARPVHKEIYWGGADIVITTHPIPVNPDAFYPPHRQFVTPHASEATWLFESLRDLLAPLIDFQSKFAFYESLAIAGERCADWSDMRNAILDEARRWVDEAKDHVDRTENDVRIH